MRRAAIVLAVDSPIDNGSTNVTSDSTPQVPTGVILRNSTASSKFATLPARDGYLRRLTAYRVHQCPISLHITSISRRKILPLRVRENLIAPAILAQAQQPFSQYHGDQTKSAPT